MHDLLEARCAGVTVGPGRTHGALTVFPLLGEQHGSLAYCLLGEALAADVVTIEEQPRATVPELVAHSTARQPIFIMDGEELAGGDQNRIANTSMLIGRGVTVLPVSCVEEGRWDGTRRAFQSPEAGFLALRVDKAFAVSASLYQQGVHQADQLHIWEQVAARQVEAQVASPSSAMADLYSQRGSDLAAFAQALPYPPGAVGLVVALGGTVVALDLFDAPATAAALWSKLVRAAAVDALVTPPSRPPGRAAAARLLERVRTASTAVFRAPGLGQDVRLHGRQLAGAALCWQDVVVHLALFRTQPEATGSITALSRRRAWHTQPHQAGS